MRKVVAFLSRKQYLCCSTSVYVKQEQRSNTEKGKWRQTPFAIVAYASTWQKMHCMQNHCMGIHTTRARQSVCEVGVFSRNITKLENIPNPILWGATLVHCPWECTYFSVITVYIWLCFECSPLHSAPTHNLHTCYTLHVLCSTIKKTKQVLLTFIKATRLCPSPVSITLTCAILVSIKTIPSIAGIVSLCANISVVCDSSILRVCQHRTATCFWIIIWMYMIYN